MDAGALGLSSGVFYEEAYAAPTSRSWSRGQRGGAQRRRLRHPHPRRAGRHPAGAAGGGATARQSGLPLVISHHKCAGPANWGRTRETLPLIEELARGQAIGMDVYPYTAGSTVLREDLVDGIIDMLHHRRQPHPEMGGRYSGRHRGRVGRLRSRRRAASEAGQRLLLPDARGRRRSA